MEVLTAAAFAAMMNNGYKNIKIEYEKINDLNVFPVPDGDTGTNVTATLTGGMKALEKNDLTRLDGAAASLAHGMLLGARGNSGVIVSQFFSGVSDGLNGLESANLVQFAHSLETGVAKAYKAVVTPVEGTILTVAREGSEYVNQHLGEFKDFESLFDALLKKMNVSLQNTPNLLDVLKEAGVIDSGGAALVTIIEGMYKQLTGEELEDHDFHGPSNSINAAEDIPFDEDSVLEYGYCTEFILQLLNCKNGVENFSLQEMIDFLSTLGDSIVALQDGTIVKVHVHTKVPGKVIAKAQEYGEFVTFKMENMSIQHNEVLLKEIVPEKRERSKVAIIAVAPSEKVSDLFKQNGVTETILGGQTMNPSAESFVSACEAANADEIIVFPNNGNVILTAEQAAKLYPDSKIHVIPTKSAIECYSLIGMFDFVGLSIEENIENALEQLKGILSASISIAVRDSVNNGLTIHKDDYIGICGGTVRSSCKTLREAVVNLFQSIEDIDDRSVITVFYGKSVTEETKAEFRKFVEASYSLMDLVEFQGEQDVYPLILAIE